MLFRSDIASLACLLLTSCCASGSLKGHRPVPVCGPGVRDSWPRAFAAKLLYPESKISITSKPCVTCGEEFLPERKPRNCYENQY